MRRAGSAFGTTRRSHSRRSRWSAGLSLICWWAFLAGVAAETNVLRLATGPKGRVYSALGKGLKNVLERHGPGLGLQLVSSTGSVHSVRLLVAGECDLAFVQNDVAAAAYKGTAPFDKSYSGLRGLASLYTETVQIIAREAAWIRQLADLKGERVAVGPESSGTEVNAAAVLAAAGMSFGDFGEVVHISFEEAKKRLAAGTVDAVFMTAGVPTPAARGLENVCLVPIPREILAKLRDMHPNYVSKTLAAGTYAWQSEEVTTVGLRALLLTRSSLSRAHARSVVNAIFCCTEALRHFHPVAGEISRMKGTQALPLPLHRGAAQYYRRRRFIDMGLFCAACILVVCGLAFLVCRRHHLSHAARSARGNVYFKIAAVFVGILGGLVGLMWFLEGPHNENFAKPGSALWYLVLYMMSGMEDFGPNTVTGKVIACLMAFAGMGIVGSVGGLVAARLIRREEPRVPANTQKHIVVCNWNMRGNRVVTELHGPGAAQGERIVILSKRKASQEENELRDQHKEAYREVYFVQGDPQQHAVLEREGVHLAKSVIILADESAPDPDAKSALIALAIRRVCEDEAKKKQRAPIFPHIVAEALDHRKTTNLEDAGVAEIVCASDYGLGVLAQCAIHEGLSTVFRNLTTYSEETNEIRMIHPDEPEFPTGVVGKSFREASRLVNDACRGDKPVLLLGARTKGDGEEDGKVLINPTESDFPAFSEHDAVIVMSFSKPDLSHIKKTD